MLSYMAPLHFARGVRAPGLSSTRSIKSVPVRGYRCLFPPPLHVLPAEIAPVEWDRVEYGLVPADEVDPDEVYGWLVGEDGARLVKLGRGIQIAIDPDPESSKLFTESAELYTPDYRVTVEMEPRLRRTAPREWVRYSKKPGAEYPLQRFSQLPGDDRERWLRGER